MHCTYCGAISHGKFCCQCGKRVQNPLEAFRCEERRVKREFLNGKNGWKCSLQESRAADAAWLVATHGLSDGVTIYSSHCEVLPLYAKLHERAKKAERVYAGFVQVMRDCQVVQR